MEEGFRRVDRLFFVRRGHENVAHCDHPVKKGSIFIFAPRAYGNAIEALDLISNTVMSFLNIRSGTGFLSCIAASMLRPASLNIGTRARCHCRVLLFSLSSVDSTSYKQELRSMTARLNTPSRQSADGRLAPEASLTFTSSKATA